MTDFKTGDVVTFCMPDFAAWQGGKGTVLKHEVQGSKDSFYVEVTEVPPANHSIRVGHTAWLYPGWLELVKPEPKFKVGDWVKVFGRGDRWDGTVGTVQEVKIKPYGNENLYTIHKNGKGDDWKQDISENVLVFFEDQLEPWAGKEAHPSNGKKFKVGDWVEITGWGGMDGTKLQVKEVPVTTGGYYKFECRDSGFGFSDTYLKAAKAPKAKSSENADMVNGPSHYGGANNPYEVIKVAEAWGFHDNAYLFNALKYLGRCEHKGNKVKDLKKLLDYVQREIALEEAK